jgi:hypothetical protein
MKYVLTLLLLIVSLNSAFAQVDDTICRGNQETQVDAWIVFVDNGTTNFVKCFKWNVLQPVGWDMVYIDSVDVDTDNKPTKVVWLDAIWVSEKYGAVYRLPTYRQTQLVNNLVWGTASTPSTRTPVDIKKYISLWLIRILAILWVITTFARTQKD